MRQSATSPICDTCDFNTALDILDIVLYEIEDVFAELNVIRVNDFEHNPFSFNLDEKTLTLNHQLLHLKHLPLIFRTLAKSIPQLGFLLEEIKEIDTIY